MSISKILENTLIRYNELCKPALEYGNDGSKSNGLKIKGTYSILIRCTKSQAIDILEFCSVLDYKRIEIEALESILKGANS